MGKVIGTRWGLPVTLVGLLLLAGATLCAPDIKCGVRQLDAIGLVVKGTDVQPGDWPWHVAIYDEQVPGKPKYSCGGSIISKYFVLSAAHCFREPNPNRYYFKVGVHRLDKDADSQQYTLFEIILHPQSRRLFNDIALVRPNEYISFRFSNVRPICLWSDELENLNVLQATGTTVGFGFNENHTVSTVLQQTAMNVTTKQRCLELTPDYLHYLVEDGSKLCAIGTSIGSNVCSGDSGGGLYFARDNVWYLRGIVSAGARKDLGNGLTSCDTSVPAMYTDVRVFAPWIAAHERTLDERNLLKDDTCGFVRNANVTSELDRPVFNQYPWNVLLEFKEKDKPQIHLVCSGVLVHRRFVLTVGHCVDGILSGFFLASVRLGEFNLRSIDDSDASLPGVTHRTQSVDVETIIRHPQMNRPMYSNDLALIKLKHDADTTRDNIKPICLPSLDDFKSDASLTLTGWKRNKSFFPRLERDAMNLTLEADCRREYGKLGVNLPSTNDLVCAKHRQAAKADCNNYATGSPLQYIKVVDRKPRYFLAGLVVLNFPFCRKNGSDVFVSINEASEWIKSTVN